VSSDAPGSEAGLREELARQEREVTRLRGLLVSKDAELGDARGRLAEMEASPLHVGNTLRRARRLVPGPLRRALGRLRKPRG
jgi:hypothetical protein